MKIDLRLLSGCSGYFNKISGAIIPASEAEDKCNLIKLPEYSQRLEDIEFINTIENINVRNFLLSNYDNIDDRFVFNRYLESHFELGWKYSEFIDDKELEIVKQWADENKIDYYISEN